MDKEKFVQRVNMMLYHTCGCNKEESIDVLEECLARSKGCKNFPKDVLNNLKIKGELRCQK